ncbi:MAG: glycosyl hydrolase 53 family protein [Clostridiales bacterium]|nr:glycosyl hydrolase 53 family protein [Clostridiales bacterium]
MSDWITGMDLSTLQAVEKNGGTFYDRSSDGENALRCAAAGDAMEILQRYGMNLVRLRLWNDPFDAEGNSYGAGGGDIETTLALAKRAKNLGIGWLLDFHYSDFWADPGKQRVPKAWRGMNAGELTQAIYDFTMQVLKRCREEDILPQIVAVGNELSNGLLWPLGQLTKETPAPSLPVEMSPCSDSADTEDAPDAAPDQAYRNVASFVNAGIRAVRDFENRINAAQKIHSMLHLDNGGNNQLYRTWFDRYFANGGEDFEYIGLSYYPFWHGSLDMLRDNMNDIALRYGKKLVVAEVSMGFTMEDYAAYEKLEPQERKGMATKPKIVAAVPYPMTPQGQADFMRDVIQVIRQVPNGLGKGFIYWEPAWLPVPNVGWANAASCEYIQEPGPYGNEWANQALFDYDGNTLPALEVIREYAQMR